MKSASFSGSDRAKLEKRNKEAILFAPLSFVKDISVERGLIQHPPFPVDISEEDLF